MGENCQPRAHSIPASSAKCMMNYYILPNDPFGLQTIHPISRTHTFQLIIMIIIIIIIIIITTTIIMYTYIVLSAVKMTLEAPYRDRWLKQRDGQ